MRLSKMYCTCESYSMNDRKTLRRAFGVSLASSVFKSVTTWKMDDHLDFT